MNYKKIITSILLVSDGPVEHAYFCDNFEISEKELIKLFNEINNSLNDNEFGFKIKYNDLNSDFLTSDDVTKELIDFKPPSILRGLSTPALETLSIVAYEQPVTKNSEYEYDYYQNQNSNNLYVEAH